MNANELAKYLDRLNGYADMPRDILDITQPAATMLRQQQAEIERLQKLCESYIKSDYEGTSMFKPFMEELYGKAQE